MTETSQPGPGSARQPKPTPEKQDLKILMLHGYTQSGPLFRSKTRALEKLLCKTLLPAGLSPTLLYPTGPCRLSPRDVPGFEPEPGQDVDEESSTSYGWFRRDDSSGVYRFFDEGMLAIAAAIREAGGVHGVVGFSQGGAVAGVVAAALEEGRDAPGGGAGWVREMRDANGGRALKFAVVYSGFFGRVDSLSWCYEPRIKTPTLHYLGSLDTVVEESRSQGLIDRCQDPVVVTHPGGHYVPISREWVMPLAGFVKQQCAPVRAGI